MNYPKIAIKIEGTASERARLVEFPHGDRLMMAFDVSGQCVDTIARELGINQDEEALTMMGVAAYILLKKGYNRQTIMQAAEQACSIPH